MFLLSLIVYIKIKKATTYGYKTKSTCYEKKHLKTCVHVGCVYFLDEFDHIIEMVWI